MGSSITKHNHPISRDTINLITNRYRQITKAVNGAFWDSDSETDNSRYVGSYGRGTAITTSDLDVLIVLPDSEYKRFSNRTGNGQSQLLQTVKNAVGAHYASTNMSGDGQIVQVNFSDGMRFEILPAFKKRDYWNQWDGTYIYPDSNMGGNWMTTNPLAEQRAMSDKNGYWQSNGLLKDTCKHIRYIRDAEYPNAHLIDAFGFIAMTDWHWLRDGEEGNPNKPRSYEEALQQYYQVCDSMRQYGGSYTLSAPGSGMRISLDTGWEVLGKVLNKMM